MKNNNLIFTLSGIRGIANRDLHFDVIKKIAIAFGLWLGDIEKKVIICRDTRESGKLIEQATIEGLLSTDFQIINLGICPAPVLIHAKNKLSIPAAIIITGSHNPQEWNGLKLLSSRNYLSNSDLRLIKSNLPKIDLNSYHINLRSSEVNIRKLNPIPNYINDLYQYIQFNEIRENNNLKILIDTGAGAGNLVTPQILTELGCKVKLINNEFKDNNTFPREIEPIEKNLTDLKKEVCLGKFDVGFAHDTDADRLAIIGENGDYYPEDMGLALITEDILKNELKNKKDVFFITNLASSLMFEVIAEKYNVNIIRTPVGERFLIKKMDQVIKEGNLISKKHIVFGGEGSCGGIIFPQFNKTRDGIFAAAKIIEILTKTGKTISTLVSKLPRFYSYRQKIAIKNNQTQFIINQLKDKLINQGEEVRQINFDLRFGQEKEWFILIHPSNTESIIRVISEARTKSLAKNNCEMAFQLVKSSISDL